MVCSFIGRVGSVLLGCLRKAKLVCSLAKEWEDFGNFFGALERFQQTTGESRMYRSGTSHESHEFARMPSAPT